MNYYKSNRGRGSSQVASVLAFSPMIRVRIPLKPTVFSIKFVFEKYENKQKEAAVGPF